MDFSSASTTELIISGLFVISWFIQLWFLLVRIRPLAFHSLPAIQTEATNTKPVSVIICAKNESENLEKFLPKVLTQEYPEFEVIVVNDCSEDDSEMVLARLKEKYPHLYYTNIPVDRKFSHGKKLALTIGVKAAKNNHLVLTDADCYPTSEKWLSGMMQGFKEGKEIVLGVGTYEKQSGFANLLTRYDTFVTAIQYLGYALSKKPYMGVGRNLAYKKELFVKNNGVKSHSHILSGDDDLFVQSVANKHNTEIIINPEAQTISTPPGNLSGWRRQKARHLTTAPYYKGSIKRALFSDLITRQILIAFTILLIIFNTFAIIAAGLFLFMFVIRLLFNRNISIKLAQGRLHWWMLIFEFIHPWYLLWAQLANLFSRKKSKWK
ncbi:glycosyltransferase [Alkalitalea saponilacus]|uniref:Glycosyltransferase, catalytic subunit of cellulose synthase and poly-beta-1,6-N-acetylglucosamine synthase n=1 Tax=Alkalitalea saponilacus TaxID=889453 RepID=A0A1T5HFW3_9BACT|nr:glycosyltransferase [Alkalitalea saponilacus]ASB48106.1 transmembrane glycosyltransferase [Alkalitalea saponilacus]SKC19575.1 Glycosyltransferase, catalytic subunit of cellulose synthase and poly-beta-1,6-N-acetylglucosamine synthase [Alkalitalea saponilacus]